MIWANLLAIPILLLLSILQIGIVSRLPLLQGTADLLLLAIIAWTLQRPVRNGWFWALVASGLTAFTSAISPIVPIISYGVTLGLVQFFKRQVWQAPLLIMLFLTLIGTFLYHSLTIAQLLLSGTSVPILDSLKHHHASQHSAQSRPGNSCLRHHARSGELDTPPGFGIMNAQKETTNGFFENWRYWVVLRTHGGGVWILHFSIV